MGISLGFQIACHITEFKKSTRTQNTLLNHYTVQENFLRISRLKKTAERQTFTTNMSVKVVFPGKIVSFLRSTENLHPKRLQVAVKLSQYGGVCLLRRRGIQQKWVNTLNIFNNLML